MGEDVTEFNNEYPDLVEWAQDHLDGIYHNEYFQIQKLNNQLIDSQRALIRSMKRPDAAKIPIIALTANAFAKDITKSIAAGMDAYITKPINGEKLKECILHLLVSR